MIKNTQDNNFTPFSGKTTKTKFQSLLVLGKVSTLVILLKFDLKIF